MENSRARICLTTPFGRLDRQVTIAPIVFATLVERIPGVGLFQIVQTTPTHLRVRLRPAAGADPDRVWQPVHAAITHLLAEHRLGHVTVERAEESPEQSLGGKYRTVIPLTSAFDDGCIQVRTDTERDAD